MKSIDKLHSKKSIKDKPEKVSMWKRQNSELRDFMIRNDLTTQEAAKILGVKWATIRGLTNVMDSLRLARPEYLSRWASMEFPKHLKPASNGVHLDINYILTGNRTSIDHIEVKRLRKQVEELEAELRRLYYLKKLESELIEKAG